MKNIKIIAPIVKLFRFCGDKTKAYCTIAPPPYNVAEYVKALRNMK